MSGTGRLMSLLTLMSAVTTIALMAVVSAMSMIAFLTVASALSLLASRLMFKFQE